MPRVVATLEFNRFAEIAAKLPREVGDIVEQTALGIEAAVKAGMAEGKSGRMYGAHRASAPGEMPAIDTGVLAASIETERESATSYVVSTNQDYAPFLEFGTSRMAPRPFLGPAASEAEPEFVSELSDLERRLA